MKKKLAALLAAVMLVSLTAVPSAAAPDLPSQEREIPTFTEGNIPDPNDPDSPDVIEIIDEDTPLGGAEDVLGADAAEPTDAQPEQPEQVQPDGQTPDEPAAPAPAPARDYRVRVQNDEGAYEYVSMEEIEVPLSEAADVLPEAPQAPVDLRDIGADVLRATDIRNDGQMSTAMVTGNFISNADGTVKVNDKGEVEVDARSGKETAISGVTLTTEAVTTLLDAGADAVIHMDVGSFGLDQALLDTISATGGGATIFVNQQSQEITATAEMPEDSDVYSYYELKLIDENGNTIPFQGGSMTITLPYGFPSGYAGVIVNGKVVEEQELTVNPDGTASFVVTHLSTWALYTQSALGYSAPVETKANFAWVLWLVFLIIGFALGCVVSPRRRNKRKKA